MTIRKNHNSKELLLGTLLVLTGWFLWFAIAVYFRVPGFAGQWFYVSIVATFLFSALYGLTALLLSDERLWCFFWVIATLAALFIALTPLQVIATLLLILGGMYSRIRVRQSLTALSTRTYYFQLRTAFPLVFTTLALVFASSYFTLRLDQNDSVNTIFPEQRFVSILRTAEPLIDDQIPNFSIDQPVEEYILERAARDTGKNIQTLSRQEKEFIIQSGLDALNRQYAIGIKRGDTLGQIGYRITVDELGGIFPIAAAFTLFVTLRLLFIPFRTLVVLALLGIIWALERIGYIRRIEETRVVHYPMLNV